MNTSGRFHALSNVLAFRASNQDDSIVISRDTVGRIVGNGGAITILGGVPTIENTHLVRVLGGAGNDVIAFDETNGVLPSARIFGGPGTDILTSGSGDDRLLGQAGNDTLSGRGGADSLYGGSGDDTLIGGAGADRLFGDDGDDHLIWNPGDGSDLFEGGDGIDTALVNGAGADEVFSATVNGDRVQFDRTSPAPFSIDIGTSEKLELNMGAGNDTFTAGPNLGGLIQLSVNGGAGNDTINGSNAADTLIGGDGNDFVDGNQGSDVAFLGAGDDVFRWDQGDGSDTVFGDAGVDQLQFNGATGAEVFTLTANGDHAVLGRDLGNIVMDLNDVETVRITALAGSDTIHIFDTSGTDVSEIDINLNLGAGGDGAVDTITVEDDANLVFVDHGNGRFSIVGGSAVINVTGFELANDHLFINGDNIFG